MYPLSVTKPSCNRSSAFKRGASSLLFIQIEGMQSCPRSEVVSAGVGGVMGWGGGVEDVEGKKFMRL